MKQNLSICGARDPPVSHTLLTVLAQENFHFSPTAFSSWLISFDPHIGLDLSEISQLWLLVYPILGQEFIVIWSAIQTISDPHHPVSYTDHQPPTTRLSFPAELSKFLLLCCKHLLKIMVFLQ